MLTYKVRIFDAFGFLQWRWVSLLQIMRARFTRFLYINPLIFFCIFFIFRVQFVVGLRLRIMCSEVASPKAVHVM